MVPCADLLHWQSRLSAVKRLDLALLVDRQHDGMSRWIDIEPDDIAQLVDEFRIVRELELPNSMRLKTVGPPDALDGTDADARRLPHHDASPMGRLTGRIGLGQGDDAFGHLCAKRSNARRSGLVAKEALKAFMTEALLPAPPASPRLAGLAHDLIRADPAIAEQDDLHSPSMLLSGVAV